MTEIIVGSIVIIVTALLADKASEKWRKGLWVLFVVLVIGQAYVQIKARLADRKDAEKNEAALRSKLDDLQSQLDDSQSDLDTSLLNEGEMKGKLKLIGDIMGKAHCPGLSDIASAVKSDIEESKTKEHQALIERAHVINTRLGQAWWDHELRYNSIYTKRHIDTPEQKRQVANEEADALRDYNAALVPIVDEAKFVRSQILQRLGTTIDEDKKWDESFTDPSPSKVVGSNSGLGRYMESLARRLSAEDSPK